MADPEHAAHTESQASGEHLPGEDDRARLERLAAIFEHTTDAIVGRTLDGTITVSVRHKEKEARAIAVVAVRDEGIGIPAADLPHVLEHGFRAGNVRGSVVHGSGLGLAGARLVAQQHGGSLEVTSREGEGTTVTLRLPLEAGAAQPSGAPAPATLA